MVATVRLMRMATATESSPSAPLMMSRLSPSVRFSATHGGATIMIPLRVRSLGRTASAMAVTSSSSGWPLMITITFWLVECL